MSAPKQPKTYSPGEAADAAIGTAGAGELMSIADQPIEQFGNLYTSTTLGPAEMQAQQGLAGQAALQGAKAQQAIQSQVDPMAYAQRQMRMEAANKRLGNLYSVDPNSYSYSAPEAFSAGSTANVPDIDTLGQTGRTIASRLSLSDVNGAGRDPVLMKPSYLG